MGLGKITRQFQTPSYPSISCMVAAVATQAVVETVVRTAGADYDNVGKGITSSYSYLLCNCYYQHPDSRYPSKERPKRVRPRGLSLISHSCMLKFWRQMENEEIICFPKTF